MRNGRINERNIGHSKINGGCKQRGSKLIQITELTEEQEGALNSYRMIKDLIESHECNYYSYISISNEDIIQHWIKNEIITIGTKKSKMPDIFPDKQICILNESKIDDLKMTMGLLKNMFELPSKLLT